MSTKLRIQDLPAEEIAELLAKSDKEVTLRQAVAIQEFITDIGGVQNALAAVEMLGELRDVA
jgi:hypothetical protein